MPNIKKTVAGLTRNVTLTAFSVAIVFFWRYMHFVLSDSFQALLGLTEPRQKTI